MEYQVTSERLRNYKRSVVIDGILVSVEVSGREGTVTSDVELSDNVIERLSRFYGIEFVSDGETVEDTESEETVTEEVVEEVVEQVEETVETAEEVVDAVVEEVTDTAEEVTEEVVETVEEVVEEVVEEEPVVSLEDVDTADVEETENNTLSKTEVERLYEEFGSWTNVAEHLGLSDYRLKKLRDELGL